MRKTSSDHRTSAARRWRGASTVLLAGVLAGSAAVVRGAEDPSVEVLRERLEHLERQQQEMKRENRELRRDLRALEDLRREQSSHGAPARRPQDPGTSASSEKEQPLTVEFIDEHEVEWWP